MRTLAFDGRMGASGDMILGALLAAGADPAVLEPVETGLDLEYDVGETTKNGIAATTVDVRIVDDCSADHSHDDHTPAEGHGPHRAYEEVIEIVEGLDLGAVIEADATAIFEILGEAEAAVHGTELTDTHFHEVGADDAIADVIGSCLLLDDLDPERVVTTPLATGDGEVDMSHGTYPIPTPAVIEIAQIAEWELRGGPITAELLTPTGAAILAHVAEGIDMLPPLRVESAGYGAGDHDFTDRPNVLRALLGETRERLRQEPITVLETHLDDATPEVLGGLQTRLVDVGALDVSIVPTTMKKSRPGHLVKIVTHPADAERVATRLAEETGTLGVRDAGASHRWVADRTLDTVELQIDGQAYEVDVKVASAGGEIYDVSGEFDDARAVADESGLPVREVLRRAENRVRDEES